MNLLCEVSIILVLSGDREFESRHPDFARQVLIYKDEDGLFILARVKYNVPHSKGRV